MIASLGRVFRLTDKLNLDVRVDATNILNHVVFGSYNTQLNPQFGLPSSIRTRCEAADDACA